MVVQRRLNALEKTLGLGSGPCHTCGGEGSEGGSVMLKEGELIPRQAGCLECGRVGVPQSVIILHEGVVPPERA